MAEQEFDDEDRAAAYEYARREIAEANAAGETDLYLDSGQTDGETAALSVIPPEIADLGELTHLDLRDTQVADLAPLQAMTGLQELYLDDTQVADLAPLQAMTGLQTLWLDNTQVADLAPLQAMTGLQTLGLNNTQVADLSPLQAMTRLQRLHLNNTQVADLAPLQAMTGLQMLTLNNTQVADLLPLAGLSKLGEGRFDRLWFSDTPAADRDDAHQALAAIEDDRDRAKQVLQYLNGEHPKFGGPPEAYAPPKTSSPQEEPKPLTVSDLPEQEEDLAVSETGGKLEVKQGTLSAEDDDPVRRSLHQRLCEKVQELKPYGNRFYRLDPKIRRLSKALDCPFEDLNPVAVWIELEELRADLATDNNSRELPYDAELLSALETTLTFGGGLVMGTRDVDAVEIRAARMRERTPPEANAETDAIAQQILDDPTPWGEQLRAYLGITSSLPVGESRRFLGIRLVLVRNALIGAGGYFLANLTDTATGGLSQAILEWLAAHAGMLKTYAATMAEGSGAWLVRLADMAQEMTGAAASVGQPPRPKGDDDK